MGEEEIREDKLKAQKQGKQPAKGELSKEAKLQ
jgi:hypothetical protein